MTIRGYHAHDETPRRAQARQHVADLTNELTALYARFSQVAPDERSRMIARIADLRAALADASDEYRRARCGAPRRERPYALDLKKQHGARLPGRMLR
jgi:hypothetical protein